MMSPNRTGLDTNSIKFCCRIIRQRSLLFIPGPRLIFSIFLSLITVVGQTTHDAVANFPSMSDEGQDLLVERLIGKLLRGGRNGNVKKRKPLVFEAGANDGWTGSNSLYFEKKYNWDCALAEPNIAFFKKVLKNRPSCVAKENAFLSSSGSSIMSSEKLVD